MRTRRHSPLTTRSRGRFNHAPRFDSLESRQLLAVSVIENPLPMLVDGASDRPGLIARASDGAVWSISTGGATDAAQRTDSQGVTSDVSGLFANELVRALFPADSGSVWAVTSSHNSGHVVKLNANYSVAGSLSTNVDGACLGPDGDIWIVGSTTTSRYTQTYSIEKFDPGTGIVTTYPAPTPTSFLQGILAGPDGNLWFSVYDPSAGSSIAKITTSGQITSYPTVEQVKPVAVSSDGKLQLVSASGTVSEMTTDGVISPITSLGSSLPYYAQSEFAAAPDGSLWFVAPWQNGVGRVGHDGAVSYTPLPSGGSQTTSIIGDGGTGFYVSQTNTIDHIVTGTPEPTIAVSVRSLTQNEGSLPAGLTLATFTTTDAGAVISDFVAVVAIDGQPPHYTPISADGFGGFAVKTPGNWYEYEVPGTHLITVTIIDAKHGNTVGAQSSGYGVATIIDPPIVVTGRTFQAFSGVPYRYGVVSLYDPGTGNSSYVSGDTTIDWGDGSPTNVGSDVYRDGNYPQYDGIGSPYFPHVYAANGTYTVTIREDHNGIISTGTSTAVVSDPPPISFVSTSAPYLTLGEPSTIFAAYFTSQNPSTSATDFTATIDWGDGTNSPGTISHDPWATDGQFYVNGFHAYSQVGNYTSIVTIQPVGYPTSAAATATFSVYVYDAGATTTTGSGYAVAGQETEIKLASFDLNQSQARLSDFTAAIDWGDGSTGFGEVLGGPTHFTVWGQHTFTSAGLDTIQTVVSRAGTSNTTNVTTSLDVTSPLQSLTPIPSSPSDRTIAGNLAEFTPGSVGALSNYAATIDWGDGTTSPGTLAANGSQEVVSGSHTYADGGEYTRIVTIQYGDAVAGSVVSSSSIQVAAIASITSSLAGLSQGHTSRVQVASFTTADANEFASDYAAVVLGNGKAATNAEIVAQSGGVFAVFGTFTPTSWGEGSVTVIVTPNGGAPASTIVTTLTTPAPIRATALSLFIHSDLGHVGESLGDAAVFTSTNPGAKASDFTATIAWGDGTTSSVPVADYSGGGFYVDGNNHFYAVVPTTPVVVTIINLGSDGSQTIGARLNTSVVVGFHPERSLILGPAVTIAATENQSWSGSVVTFGVSWPDTPVDLLKATIHWGDGSPNSIGQIVLLDSGQYEVKSAHVFAQPGDYTTTIDLSVTSGEPVTATSTFHVAAAPFVADGSSLQATLGAAVSGVVAMIHGGGGAAASRYAATIDWGDGTTSPGTVSSYQDAIVVYGSHVYAKAGVHPYGVIILKAGALPVTTTGLVTVTAAATPGPAGPVGVIVVPMSIVSIKTTRTRKGAAKVVANLAGTIDTARASDKTHYVLTEAGKDGKFGTKDDRSIKVTLAQYDAKTHTVTLTPKGTFAKPPKFRVMWRA